MLDGSDARDLTVKGHNGSNKDKRVIMRYSNGCLGLLLISW